MSNLRELQTHLKSVTTVGQMSGAMRAIATSRLNHFRGLLDTQRAYCSELRSNLLRIPGSLTDSRFTDESAPGLYIVVHEDRGLCGAYPAELNAFADSVIKAETRPYVRKDIIVPEVPDIFSEKYSFVSVIFQSFKNIMVQTPVVRQLLPLPLEGKLNVESDKFGALYLPDEKSVRYMVLRCYLAAEAECMILEAQLAQQAATLMAMSSAHDNAVKASENISLAIGRQRQADITSSVIEIASGANFEE